MSIYLLLYIIINIWICVFFFRKKQGVFQFPFLIGCVSLTFVFPQLLNLDSFSYFNSGTDDIILLHMCLCNAALAGGFYYVSQQESPYVEFVRLDEDKHLNKLIIIFAIIGIVTTLMNRGVYKGGFVSGLFVIISFFNSYGAIALLLILIGYNRGIIKGKWFAYVGLTIVLLTVDKIIASGRRAATINLVLTILYFYLDKDERIYKWLRFGVPAFFVLGMIVMPQIGEYRNNAYDGKLSFWENVTSLNTTSPKVEMMEKGEIYNAIEGMRLVYNTGNYDFGGNNWNGLIRNYIPTAFVSRDFKKSLMVESSSSSLVAYLTRSGSTMTGYFDSFLSFGVFGFIKFLLIGSLMGYWWWRRNDSDISLMFYFALLTPGLHLLTHSSNYFLSELFFEMVFIYPFVKQVCSRYGEDDLYIVDE